MGDQMAEHGGRVNHDVGWQTLGCVEFAGGDVADFELIFGARLPLLADGFAEWLVVDDKQPK